MKKDILMGVIGTGRIGKLHVENINRLVPGGRVIAVADVMIEQSRAWAEEEGIKYIYNDYNELLANPEVEAVVIATPTNTHAEVAIAAAKAGKQIFLEKPVDLSLDRIHEVMEAVKAAGVICQIGFNRRFDHNFRRVREMVENGKVGDPYVIRVTSRDPAPPPISYIKVSGGLFVDMMIHDFDMVRYLSGSDAVKITAKGANLLDPAIGEAGDIDTAVVTLEMSNGAIAVIDNSRQAVYGYDQRVEVFGSKGQAIAYNDKPSTVELYTEETVSTDKIRYFFLDRYTGAFIDQFVAFIDAVNGQSEVVVDVLDGLRAVEMALAATESLHTGKTVELKL